jgi:hypothetical protein
LAFLAVRLPLRRAAAGARRALPFAFVLVFVFDFDLVFVFVFAAGRAAALRGPAALAFGREAGFFFATAFRFAATFFDTALAALRAIFVAFATRFDTTLAAPVAISAALATD